MLLTGELAPYFVGIEIILGKIVPLFILFHPRLRRVGPLLVASVLIVLGILFMRLDLVHVGEMLAVAVGEVMGPRGRRADSVRVRARARARRSRANFVGKRQKGKGKRLSMQLGISSKP